MSNKSFCEGCKYIDGGSEIACEFCEGENYEKIVDEVKQPSHYTSHPSGIECIEITKHENFPIGNALKYLWRRKFKGSEIQDLKKAIEYVEIEIKRLEDASNS